MALPHGGNIYHYSKKYGIPEEDFLDFSASVNPLGPPASAVRAMRDSAGELVNYPDPDCSRLVEALSERLGISPGSVMAGNGSTELIYLLPRALMSRSCLVMAPSYSDYERAAKTAGAGVSHFMLREKDGFMPDMARLRDALAGAGIFFICNPNNPTGRLIEKDRMLEVIRLAERAGAFTVVDEAFMDYVPAHSVAREAAGSARVAVLRNFTKFYGMPGLRAGYLVSGPSVIKRLSAVKEPWSVSTPAQRAAAAALGDEAYAARTLRLAARDGRALFEGLSAIRGIRPQPSSANFILARLDAAGPDSSGLAEALASDGMLIRDCSNFRGLGKRFIRVAVRKRADNERLVQALERRVSFTGR